MRWLRWISGIVWAFSWYTIYLEIFRWKHMTRTLRFQAPPPIDGMDAPPRAGLPLKAVCFTSVVAPVAFLGAPIAARARRAAKTRTRSRQTP
jgi:hypothetical protein